nr:hypothetical protein Iba_chr04cCG9520 [Ipomoea batatas]GMC85982.1 hypothetical protein Iba_chr04dCG6610 [Ipomoea batatas]
MAERRAGHISGQARIFAGSTRKSGLRIGFDPFRVQPDQNIAAMVFFPPSISDSHTGISESHIGVSESHIGVSDSHPGVSGSPPSALSSLAFALVT